MKFAMALAAVLLLVVAASVFPMQGAAENTTASPVLLPAAAAASSNGPADPAEVEAFLDTVMPAALARYNVPGSTVAIVKDGRLVIAKGYGYTDLANRTPVDADTALFRIGSTTKLFTWTAVMQLVEAGKIDLDADVNTYLKGMKIPDTYPGRPVTMRHLMTHTAGFEDIFRHITVPDIAEIIPFREVAAENIPARVVPPGTTASYSNYGTTLAAVVVEDVSGMPFEQYLQSRVFDPLGMKNASIREDLPADLASRLAMGYSFENSRNLAIHDTIFLISPAGTISTTAPDMAKFMLAHLQNGTFGNATILEAETAAEMHARAFTVDPRVAGMCLGFYEQYYNGRRAIAHGGDTNTFHSLLLLLPDEQTGFFVSSNSAGGRGVRDELYTSFMDHYYPAESPTLATPDPAGASRLQQYTGTYVSNRRNYATFQTYIVSAARTEITATGDGTLVVVDDKGQAEYIETAPGVFSRADGTRQASGDLVFHTAADGTVDFLAYSNIPAFVNDRASWYSAPDLLGSVLAGAEILLATVLLWPLLAAFRRANGIPAPEQPPTARFARWTAGAAAVLLLAFVTLLLPTVAADSTVLSQYLLEPGTPAILVAVLTVPVVGAVLTLVVIVCAALAWKNRYWTPLHRAHYSLIAVALLAMLWWVNINNLWVFRL
jgi:CubicO group peptidase (beta-lactamase class C family)